MRLDSALKKSRPQYISTLFDELDEHEIARSFSDARVFMAVACLFHISIYRKNGLYQNV
jgi:hypothetical protein